MSLIIEFRTIVKEVPEFVPPSLAVLNSSAIFFPPIERAEV
jgi:hypothetical protein